MINIDSMVMAEYQVDAFAPQDAENTIAVWFSCGAASAVAAWKTLEKYSGQYHVRVINNPVLEEDEDNLRFKADVERWLGVPIETAINPKYPSCSAVDVWERSQFMSSPKGAPCTTQLKKEARRLYQQSMNPAHHVLGFTSDETQRHENYVDRELPLLPVLIDEGITKNDCFHIIAREGIQRPRMYDQGYPNANCIGCVKASSPTYWNHVRRKHPCVFRERAEQSRSLGAKLVKVNGERIYLDQLDTNATGRPMKTMDVECGVFCSAQ